MTILSFSSLSSDSEPISNQETALSRLSRNSSFQKTELNSTQTAVDQGVTHFLDGVFDTKTGLALLGGGVANRLGKLGFAATVGSRAGSGSLVSTLVRGGSSLAGFTIESAAFAGLSQGFLSPSFSKNWAHAAATLGPLKIFPSLFPNQNLVLQHLLTDLGMVAGDHLAYRLGVGEKPEGDLSTQMARAEALNWQMKGTLSLAHGLLPHVAAIEKTMDLALVSQSRGPRFFDLSSPEPLAVVEGDPRELRLSPELPSKERLAQENILAMTALRDPNSGGETAFRKPTDAEIKQVKQEFSEALLTQLFGKYHGRGAEVFAAFFVNRPEMKEKYGAKAFAEANLAKRRSLLSDLIKDSESIRVSFEQAPGPAQEGLFAQAMNIFCYFQDHNKVKLTELKWSVFKGGTNPLPDEFVRPNINIGGGKLHILTNFRGLYELGRSQFFGDTAVSPKHLFLHYYQGLWYIVDGGSHYGTYYYDAAKKSWEAFSNQQWKLLQSKDILNIGNAYYKMFIIGGTIHFDPVSLPAEIEPNTIRRVTSVTFNGKAYPMEIKPTPRGEVGRVQVGTILFLYERGSYSVLNLGQDGLLRLKGVWVPTAFNQNLQQIDYTKAHPLNNRDNLDYFGQKHEVWIDENGMVNVSKQSAWATFNPPAAFNPQAPIVHYEWYASGPPMVEENKIKMNGAQTLLIGRMGKMGVTEPLSSEAGIYQHSIEDKPWYYLSFSGPVWVQIKKEAAGQRFEITNVGIKEGIEIQDSEGKPQKIEKGQLRYMKAGGEILFRGRQWKGQP